MRIHLYVDYKYHNEEYLQWLRRYIKYIRKKYHRFDERWGWWLGFTCSDSTIPLWDSCTLPASLADDIIKELTAFLKKAHFKFKIEKVPVDTDIPKGWGTDWVMGCPEQPPIV